ncbi:hypothetical protein CKJ90_29115, partial [Klebsiella pneumoniae]
MLAVMGMIAFGFLLFILFTSNPFSRGLPQYPIDGRDLNPLLQDIGMISIRRSSIWVMSASRWPSPSPSPRCWRPAALDAVARVLAVMGMIAFGFLLFILFTSNPFSRG